MAEKTCYISSKSQNTKYEAPFHSNPDWWAGVNLHSLEHPASVDIACLERHVERIFHADLTHCKRRHRLHLGDCWVGRLVGTLAAKGLEFQIPCRVGCHLHRLVLVRAAPLAKLQTQRTICRFCKSGIVCVHLLCMENHLKRGL